VTIDLLDVSIKLKAPNYAFISGYTVNQVLACKGILGRINWLKPRDEAFIFENEFIYARNLTIGTIFTYYDSPGNIFGRRKV